MRHRREDLRWNGWGRRDVGFETHGRDAAVWAFVADALGTARLPSTPAPSLEDTGMPESRASAELLEKLGRATHPSRVHTSREERAFHAHGRSYYDLLRLRSGALDAAPDVIVYPETREEVQAVLALAEEARFAVVPFGGGSSVVGGVEATGGPAHAGVLTLDTTRMARVLEVDGVSRTATVEAGIYGPALEEALSARGFVLGHFPQSFEYSTLGGWIAARGAGQLSNRYGSADKLVVAATVVTPRGVLRTQAFPASAAGPNLNQVLAGSEGTLGVITDATVKLHALPESRKLFAFLFKSFEEGVGCVRALVQEEAGAAMMRLSDADETRFFGAFRGVIEPSRVNELAEGALGVVGYDNKCVLMICVEGERDEVAHRVKRIRAIAKGRGALYVGEGPGRSWWKRRFEMPFLRDPMLDHGVGVDTLETATEWSNVPRLYEAVRLAIRGTLEGEGRRAIVMAHVSHSYADGASLYFTFIFLRDVAREIAQWKAIKHAASQAIVQNGGTISHHHGVGTDHAPFLDAEKGPLGLDVLAHARKALDPKGTMNPGKLLPARG
jgi:alkyldihydroxyacetonephosphate synthase